MIDPLLLVEFLDNNEDWGVHHLADNKGVFIGPDKTLYRILEEADLELE